MYDLERYLNVRSAYDATFGPDGQLSFRMNTTGVAQVWTLDAPGTWPDQRTFYDEPISFASYSPTRPELIFGMDAGSDERMQLYRLDPDGDPPADGHTTFGASVGRVESRRRALRLRRQSPGRVGVRRVRPRAGRDGRGGGVTGVATPQS